VLVWIELARLAQIKQEVDLAATLLDEAEQKLGDSVMLRLARATHLVGRHGGEARDQLRQLAENTEQFSEAQRLQLWNGLLSSSRLAGDREQSRKLCRRVAEKKPDSLQVWLQLLNLAFESGDAAGIKQILKEVERIEGKGPLWHYGEAIRLKSMAKEGEAALLDQALQHVTETRKLSPTWSSPVVLAAQIYQQQRKWDPALQDYLLAINKLGSRDRAALFAAAKLLFGQGRRAEAAEMIRLLEDQQIRFSNEAKRLVREIKFYSGDVDGALELAKEAAADSDKYQDHGWLARILAEKALRAARAGQTEEAQQMYSEAEESLRHVVDLAEDVPEIWVELIRFLAATGQVEKAEDALREARDKIPPDRLPLALAQSYESMGRLELAEQHCEEALAAAPQDPAIARYVADYYYRKGRYLTSEPSQQSQAILRSEAILRRIISGEVKGQRKDVIWARRRLAFILQARGKYEDRENALSLIEENLAASQASIEDLRYKANLLALDRDPERRKQAAEILENLPRQHRLASPEDRFTLWQLYVAQGAWTKATAQMRSLLASHGEQPLYVAAYVRALLARNQLQDAELWLKRLEKIAPHWFSSRNFTTTTGLRAELLFQRKRYIETFDLMNRFVGNSDARPSNEAERSFLAALTLEQFARRLEDLGEEEMADRFIFDADTLCRKYVRQRPGREWLRVAFLARQDRIEEIEEAVSLLEAVWFDTDPVATAAATAGLLRSSVATEAQLQRVEKVVREALEKFGRPIPLLQVLAQACTSQGRYREAEKFYREIIEKNSFAYEAMNNLAVLLALRRTKLQEALQLVNRAIELAGAAAPLLDSRASVYMALGQPRKALDDLKKAIAEEATPVRYFHQAQAYRQNGQPQAAIETLEEAQRLGLQPEMLEFLERPAYKRMLTLLK
jgi:tetratricopeptide (TPR) repeat protein